MADIGYARASKRVQNLDLQTDALQGVGCQPIFADKLSGAINDRPQLTQALQTVRRGDTLVVWRLDRLGRSLQHLVAVVGDLQQRGVRFRSLKESIDTSGATGRLIFHVLAALAEFERELIIERTTAGLAAARVRGRVGGPPPYGFAADHTGIVEAEATLLREAATRLVAREPASHVIDDWDRRGIVTRRGGHWTVTSLRTQLLNPKTIQILGAELHGRVAGLFGAPDRRQLGRPSRHLLSGILQCGNGTCQQKLYARQIQQRWVYRCERGSGSGGRFHGCGRISISLPRADRWARDAFIVAICGPPLAKRLTAQLETLHAGGPTPEQLAAEREELVELEIILGTRFGTLEHRRRAAELQACAAAAEDRMRAVPDLAALASLPRVEDELRAKWKGWTVPERRVWLKRMFDHVGVLPAPAGTHHRGSDIDKRLDPRWKA